MKFLFIVAHYQILLGWMLIKVRYMTPRIVRGLKMASQDSYFKLCVVEANTTRLGQLLEPQRATIGKGKKKRTTFFYELKYDIILSLGLTVYKAEIAWKENVGFIPVRVYTSSLRMNQGREVRYVTLQLKVEAEASLCTYGRSTARL